MTERRKGVERRIKFRNESHPTKEEMRAVFHRLWGSQVNQRNYSKRDWVTLQIMLFRLTGMEV